MNQSLKIYLGNFNTIPYEFKTSTGVLGIIHPVLYGYLLRSSEAQEISPGIIEKWEFDHKDTFTLKLGNTKFHNGREVNAKDLEFSIIRGFISDYPNYNKIHFSDIDGIEKLKVGEKYQSGMASGIQVVDQKTLKIKIKNKNPMFLINFTIPFVPLVPIEELSDNYFTWKNTPVGAGPYRIQDQFKDHVLTLVKSDQLHSGANKIEYHSERKKVEYDILMDSATSTNEEANFKPSISKYPSMITSMFFYRNNRFAKNRDFRKAIHHAINRDKAILDSIFLKPSYYMQAKPYSIETTTKNPFDLNLAKQYIKKLPSYFFNTEIKVGVFSGNKEFPIAIKKQLKKIETDLQQLGLKFTFEVNQEKFPTKEVMDKFAIKLWSKVIDLADPSVSYGAMSERSPYKDEIPDSENKFDNAYQKAVSSENFDERMLAIQNIAKVIEEDALIVPLFERYVLYRTNPKTIKSLGDHVRPMFLDLSLVEMH